MTRTRASYATAPSIHGVPLPILKSNGEQAGCRSISALKESFAFVRRQAEVDGAVALTRWGHAEFVLLARWHYDQLMQIVLGVSSGSTKAPRMFEAHEE